MTPQHPRPAGPGRIARRAAVVLILLLAGCTPGASPPTPSPTASVTSSPSAPPIDSGNWIVYESKQYDFTIKHPPGWRVIPANHDWTLKADANDWLSRGQEGFVSPDGAVFATVWSTPATDTPNTVEGVAAWVEKYCQQIGEPCSGIQDRAVPLCNQTACHPGLLVTLASQESRGFFTGGDHVGQIVGVAVHRPEWEVAVEKYGGARRLLEGFLSGMDVCPARPDQTPPGCP